MFFFSNIHELHYEKISFIEFLLKIYMSANTDIFLQEDNLLNAYKTPYINDQMAVYWNDLKNFLLFHKWQNLQRNCLFIAFVALWLLGYAQNINSNVFRRIARHAAFPNNIPKYNIEFFYKIRILIFYKNIHQTFVANRYFAKTM